MTHANIEDRRVRDLFGELLDKQADAPAGISP